MFYTTYDMVYKIGFPEIDFKYILKLITCFSILVLYIEIAQ